MIERKIIIGLITSTEFCLRIKEIWNKQLIESTTAKRLADWVWEYFDKYNKAPGKEIQTIYYAKLKDTKIPKDIIEEIEEILAGLSKEFEEEEFNLEYLFEETEKHFNARHIQIHTENVQTLIAAGEIEKADKMVREFKPLLMTSGKLDNFIRTVHAIRSKNRPKPTIFMRPWLKAGQVTIIYGNYGCGKSLLTISIAYVLGVRNWDSSECEIGKWQVKNPTGTLYIDGELGEQEMEERVRQFEWLGKQPPGFKLQILSVPEYQLETEDSFYLSDRKNQQKIIKWLKEHPTYRIVVLDSASTLFGLEDENNNSEWNNKINPFLRDLKALDVACILLHHSGKSEKRGLRGASSMGAMAHNIFRIVPHEKKSLDRGEAWFVINKDKQRAAGFSFKTFALKYTQDEDQSQTSWEVTNNV